MTLHRSPPPTLADFRHRQTLRVRWAEVDAQGIVFNPHHLVYLDTAVAGYWRAMALPYDALTHRLGGDLYTRKSTMTYDAPARCDDVLRVGLRTTGFGRSTFTLQGIVERDDVRISHGELLYVYADRATGRSAPVPAELRDWIEAFERGEAMTRLQVGGWDATGDAAAALRRAVFLDEQRLPAALGGDADDASSLHVLVRDRAGDAVATGRLMPADADGTARIGRIAVRRELRGSGFGTQVLQALVAAARERGDRVVLLDARASAVGFYQRLGFSPRGSRFEEAGVEHQTMGLDVG